ncbi:hypothetical protein TNCV_1669931 [Trichonephila clavipes]|nr:hypothetical protein TNCV_1669931 [Trichonephila clavipes]
MVLKANDRRTSCPCHDEFRGPRSDYVRQAVTKRVFQSIDCGTICVTCCAVLFEPQLLDIMIVQFRNEKVSNHGSIPITIDSNVVAFIVFEEGFHQPIKRTKQSVFQDVTVFRHTLVISFTPNAAVLFVDVAILPEVRFIAEQNSLMKIPHRTIIFKKKKKIAQFESVVQA